MIGVDEVGRGAWAGPLVVVAARQTGDLPDGLKDSKQLTRIQRENLLDLLSKCCSFGEGWVSPAEIDYHGLAGSLKIGAERALGALNILPMENIILDGVVDYLPSFVRGFQTCIVEAKADAKYPIVSAASVFAKVKRDQFMRNLSKKYPMYCFEKNVGYGTQIHRAALKKNGPISDIHRMSFAPVASVKG